MRFAPLLLVLLAAPASAGDYFVDPAAGNDLNSGLTANDPVATITRALALAGTGSAADIDRIRLAPGTYGPGEAWPISLGPYQRLLGRGAGISVLDSGNAPQGIRLSGGVGDFAIAATKIANLTLRGSQAAIRQGNNSVEAQLLVEDCDFENGVGGITYDVPVGRLEVYRCRFSGSGYGMAFGGFGVGQGIDVVAGECTFDGVNGIALNERVLDTSNIVIRRCRFLGGTVGLEVFSAFILTQVTIEDSLFAGCSRAINLESATGSISRCTIVDCSTYGVRYALLSNPVLQDSILADCNVPLVGVAAWNLSGNLIEGSALAGVNGTIADAPLFRDAANGDYRLAFGSPGIDLYPSVAMDLDGVSRAFEDGDLDTVPLADLGAFEFRTLEGPSTASPGTNFNLVWHGEPGQFAWIAGTTRPSLATPLATPFGDRWLSTTSPLVSFWTVAGPDVVTSGVWDSPSLVGITFPFQALSRSTTSPTGAAWSSLVQVEVR